MTGSISLQSAHHKANSNRVPICAILLQRMLSSLNAQRRHTLMNTAQTLVELLKAYRVEHIFGVPGDTTMVLYDALYAARGEITHIMARDERSAAFMADAYARLAHKPGITDAPSGGGATYVIPGVAEANGSSVPMIVFT